MQSARAILCSIICIGLAGCATFSELSPVHLSQTTVEEFVLEMGPPTKIVRDQTVFDYGPGGWLKGCTGYGYHVLNNEGNVAVRVFYFRGNRWVRSHGADSAKRILRWSNGADRVLIQSVEGPEFTPPSLK
jgi:hypothetical protein